MKCFGEYNLDESSELVYCRHHQVLITVTFTHDLEAVAPVVYFTLSEWLCVTVSSVRGKAVFEESGVLKDKCICFV